MFLLDTNVISEFRRAQANPAVLEWAEGVPMERLYISAMTIGEVQAGIENLRERDGDRAGEIEAWLESVLTDFTVLPANTDAFRVWARLMHRQPERLLADALIAATAIVNSLTVVTRNVRDFQQLGVPVLNPFAHSE